MSRPLRKFSPDQAPATASGKQVMVYLCECGTKWTNSTKLAWECKCGRQLVKRHGIIHSATVQTSGQTTNPRNVRTAGG